MENTDFEEQSKLDKLHELLCYALQKRNDLSAGALKAIMKDKAELSEQQERKVNRLISELGAFLNQN